MAARTSGKCPLSELERTTLLAASFSAFDPSRTSAGISFCCSVAVFSPYQSTRLSRYDARALILRASMRRREICRCAGRCGGSVAVRCARAAGREDLAHWYVGDDRRSRQTRGHHGVSASSAGTRLCRRTKPNHRISLGPTVVLIASRHLRLN